ncbi:hypothetical protein Tco_1264872 [Tanacetum coccineum]
MDNTEDPKLPGHPTEQQENTKQLGPSSFNTESEDVSINLNVNVDDDEEVKVEELRRSMGRDNTKGLKKKGPRSSGSSSSMNDETSTRLMVSKGNAQRTCHQNEERRTFSLLEIKRKEFFGKAGSDSHEISHGSDTLIPDVSRIPSFVIMLVGAAVDAGQCHDTRVLVRQSHGWVAVAAMAVV